ncbi:50S ribosomal protein L13 [Candidatus Gottesmanbacteria bacterium RIFCSPHIGHO2_01_FULL_42_12]|uniref:Large ribosomal subunit protein uL13 n=1 Tax=Candidatus Gottesmanbacteria bacterium RIFCSPHIGHO2_01_FULL_42_12 TaxID=1798377 RepID=A0A1F5YZE4_9BACT|nr:MAG: 50S ribosomal protein L13 [Candidatus Gottesmanbacteria bacterium RIFCSPHIGHO2_01_FULL_42_12]
MNNTKISEITHATHEIDAQGQILGRLATGVAQLLVGKNKTYFVRHLDCGDFVTVKNAEKVKVTGKKEEKKVYTNYSGYPGGLKTTPIKRMRQERPTEIIKRAVKGMLPNNKLRDVWMSRLKFA